MNIRDIEAQRLEANNLFRQQKITEALEVYEKSLTKAIDFIIPSARNEELEEQLSLLTYNISTVYYKKKNFPKALMFALESLEYTMSDRVLYKLCTIYLRLGALVKYHKTYDQIKDKSANSELKGLLKRIKLDEPKVRAYLRNMLTTDRLFQISSMVSDGKTIPAEVVVDILEQGERVLMNCENIVHVESKEEILIFGDTHGQYFDLVGVLNTVFDGKRSFIFNGDYVDRGSHSVENFLVLIGLKILFPERIHLNRGNHELSDLNKVYGFYDEIARKYPFNKDSIYQSFQSVFRVLPISAVVNGRIFITHGGLPAACMELDDLQKPYRMMDSHADTPLRELLWSDSGEVSGVGESKRGAGIIFGSDITRKFLHLNNLDLLIRSHEAVENGYRAHHDGKVVTIFSAPNYEGTETSGSYLVLNPDPKNIDDNQVTNVSEHTKYKVVRFEKSTEKESFGFMQSLDQKEDYDP